MSDMMPESQSRFINILQEYVISATNMTHDEAYNFAFRVWQMQEYLKKFLCKAPGWISVKDRLPEPWKTVLLWDGDEMVSGHADNDGDLTYHRCGQVFRATHWMLPEPPGEEGEE